MMDGITVLSEEVVKGSSPETVLIIGIIFAIIACFASTVVVMNISDSNIIDSFLAGVLSFAFVFGCTIYYFKSLEPKASYVKYKVTIDDSVSFKEFDKRYKIVDQEGEIYTIIKKDETKK